MQAQGNEGKGKGGRGKARRDAKQCDCHFIMIHKETKQVSQQVYILRPLGELQKKAHLRVVWVRNFFYFFLLLNLIGQGLSHRELTPPHIQSLEGIRRSNSMTVE